MPSAIAVLPTPGSPTKIGLFLVRRLKICKTLRISSSRPTTGSTFPLADRSFKLTAYLFSASNVCSAVCESAFLPPRTPRMAFSNTWSFNPKDLSKFDTLSLTVSKPDKICSVVMNWSSILLVISLALYSALWASFDKKVSVVPSCFGYCSNSTSSSFSNISVLIPDFCSKKVPIPSLSARMALSKWPVSIT